MVRKAILIAGSNKGQDNTSSRNNVAFLNHFLKSRVGGYWTREEITILIDPTVEELLFAIDTTKELFRFFYFSGLGGMSDEKQYLLVENKLLCTDRLINKVSKEAIIFDCCRTNFEHKTLIKNYTIIESSLNKRNSRATYNKIIQNTSGSFIAYSTSAGKSSYSQSKSSCFIYVFAKISKQLTDLNFKGVVSINAFLKLISLSFEKGMKIQQVEINKNGSKYPIYLSS